MLRRRHTYPTMSTNIKPTHRAIKKYYEDLARIHAQGATHEGATSPAFYNLLAETARLRKWDAIHQLGTKHQGNRIVPDATIRDANYLPHGYWEAKDTADDLDTEIQKKRAKGYPLKNIIFEDTQSAILYQDGEEALRVSLKTPEEVAELLNKFFSHSEPDIEKFEEAVEEFKARVPDLANGLLEKIQEAHKDNAKFKAAFADFFALCQSSLNPAITKDTVNEMLVQHLLTERLIRTIFDNEEFTQRNVIAAEIEKVIAALTSKAFNRKLFFKSLDRFYVAIETAAAGLTEFSDKQHFLNTVYERFFQGFSKKVADTHGIVYTPQPIVDFMCASVVEVLQKEFGKTLGSKDVCILDPCTGTGNFIVNLLGRVPKKDLPRVYREQLFANEIMLLPYYIAALNIEHAYYEITGEYEPFEGLCFVDTLDMAEHAQGQLGFMTQENTVRVQRQKSAPITVIIGNPPYNSMQSSENDNNKNRGYSAVDDRIRATYARDSRATNKNKLFDPYVRFFRWALDRLGDRPGMICYVSNNSFIDQIAYDGLRKHLAHDFSRIYHVDLHGNVRKNPKLSGTTHNVFGIQVGVGITIAIRRPGSNKNMTLDYFRVGEDWTKQQKLAWLSDKVLTSVPWNSITPRADGVLLEAAHEDAYHKMIALASKDAKNSLAGAESVIMTSYSLGVRTNRDSTAYDYSSEVLISRIEKFVEAYNGEVDRYKRSKKPVNVDEFVDYDKIKWSRDLKLDLARGRYAEFTTAKIRRAHYRPFNSRYLFFDRILNEEVYGMYGLFPDLPTERENISFCATGLGAERPFAIFPTANIPDLNFFGPGTVPQWYPYYVYDEDGSNRRENITDWALKTFRERYADKKITKWDIFYYVYGILHHPDYREKYGDNLKRELPRVPFAPDFKAFATAGKKLAGLHLGYEEAEPYPLTYVTKEGVPLSYRVDDKMRLNKEKTALTVNKSLTLSGIPADTFNYRLGNRSALEWVLDQYQYTKDARTGIVSNPNRADDPEYIVRLVGQVVAVSLETNKIVNALPAEYGG